ncbi:NAD(P)-dependent oxidoreductase [Micromonospora sp. NPDC000316]|uniref:NAD(P)-dependent oxidoreductase n=1 Tax=Micromonospora sp. NPDC000316 TaxID=3364216 RepID=UPI0036B65BE4
MKIAVFGATGKTGQEIIRQALAGGHSVVALARRPEALPIRHEALRIVVGDARNADHIAAVIEGQDAVVSSLGRPAAGSTRAEVDDSEVVDVCTASTRHLFAQMPDAGVQRIVLMSTHGAGSSNDGSPYVVALRELVGNRVADKDDMEAFIAASDAPVDWTVIRNPLIYDGPAGQPYGVHEKIVLDDTSKVTYTDLAAFTLSEITEPKHVGKILTITEPLTGEAGPGSPS